MPLQLLRRPKSPNWIIRGTLRGCRVEESTGTPDKRVAEEIRAKREAEILAASIYGRQATATFAEAAVSYLENGGAPRFLTPILEHFGTKPLATIDLSAIEKAAAKLYPAASSSTRNRQVFTPTSAVLRHAAKRGLCAMPLLERPRQPRGVVRWLRPDEAERLFAASAGHLRPLLIFLVYSGARAGEALWLDWQQVDLVRRHVVFPKTKNGEARGVPLHRRVVEALKALPHREGNVFRAPHGDPYRELKGDADTSAGTRIATAFKAACRRAGISDFRVHDCRHTWASWHYAHNRDMGALMRLGGWKSERMVLRYADVNVAELAGSVDKLPGGILGDSAPSENETP